jgi:putative chitinase
MIDRLTFFAAIRRPLFGGRISPRQAEGLTILLDRWEARHAARDIRWLAYALATAHHETDRTMQPIREYGGAAYLTRMYDIRGERPALAKRMGNTTPGDGVRYCGRGYVQLTWKANYIRAGRELGLDLAAAPDRAMEPAVAADILYLGLIDGWFTGRLLADYIAGSSADWRGARRIVNGLDKADLIKGYALAYLSALQPKAASTPRGSVSSSKAHGPRATNSAPVAASSATAATSGA